jgi:hypothetical protein
MGFLAPWFLAGLAGIGLPIWIHLLRQHKTVPKPFSSLMFFERRTQSSVKHRRLQYFLLLALRIALIALLALAFANPYINRAPLAAGGNKLLVLAVDHSFSMRDGDRLARAKQLASNAVSDLRPGDYGQVMAVAADVQVLTQPIQDPAALRAAIAGIEPGDGRSSFAEFSRFLRTAAEQAKMPLEVHFASDMQASSMPPSFTDLRLAAGTNLVMHPVAAKAEPNWAVENVTAPRSLYDPKKARIQAVIAGYETQAARREVSLVLNGKVVGTKTVDVPAGGRASVQFVSLDAPYGFNRCEVRIDGADALKQDDRFDFAVERADPRRVLFIYEPQRDKALVYYRSALEAASEGEFQVEPVTVDQAGNLQWTKYAFVVLSDAGRISQSVEDSLKKYVVGGGALLITLGPSSAIRARVPVFDEAIQGSQYSGRETDQFQTAVNVDTSFPALSHTNQLDGVKFYQAIRVNQGTARVLARLTDQTPLLMEKQIGEGRVVVFTSTFDNIANDFPLNASFVPFVEQGAIALSGLQDRSSNFLVDSYVDLRTGKNHSTAVEVLDPDGKRALSLKDATTAQNFRLTREGFYEIRRANGRHEMVAVHADRRESDLSVVPPETLALWRGTGVTDATAGGVSPITGVPEKRLFSLWRYFLIILVLVALAESLVANRYLGVARGNEQGTERQAA